MPETDSKRNFITEIVDAHNETDRFRGRVHTRFPPEPNGYLHIGHAKSICLNFGIAQQYGGLCNLRFDDTNPAKEEQEYIDAIIDDVRWLGYDWGDRLFFASDYFDQLYDMAVDLIRIGRAYVDQLSPDEIRTYRGTLTAPGIESPYRDRPVEENLALFEKMRAGGFKEGEAVLRAKIDMSSGNINLRDPVMYRILDTPHPRTGNTWRIYPMYDFAHGQSDSLEGITHSICTLEYEDHRPLYDWYLDNIEIYHPQQIEFARLNLSHTVLSKRKLIRLVQEGYVQGWDDPRMPTISGLRRRGYTPEAIREFCDEIGVGKVKGVVALHKLEYHIRHDLNKRANRVMAVLNPLRVVIEKLSSRSGRRAGRNQQSGRCQRRRAQSAVLENAVYRARRFYGRSPAQILPPGARPRSAPPLCLFHHLPRGHQRREWRSDRAALHLRPRNPRWQRARWPASQSDSALGLCAACPRGRSAAL